MQDIFWLFLPRSIVCAVRHKEDSSKNTLHSFHFASAWRTDLIWMAKSPGIIITTEPFWVPEAVCVTQSWDSRAFESCLWGRATWSLTIPVLSNTTIKLHNACVWKYQTLRRCFLMLIRAVNGAKVQTHIVGFIFLMTEIIITDFKSLLQFSNLAVSMISSRSPCLYHSCLQQERRTCQHESEKVSSPMLIRSTLLITILLTSLCVIYVCGLLAD